VQVQEAAAIAISLPAIVLASAPHLATSIYS